MRNLPTIVARHQFFGKGLGQPIRELTCQMRDFHNPPYSPPSGSVEESKDLNSLKSGESVVRIRETSELRIF